MGFILVQATFRLPDPERFRFKYLRAFCVKQTVLRHAPLMQGYHSLAKDEDADQSGL